MTNIVNGYDLDTQSGRANFRTAGGWVEGNASGGYDYQAPNGAVGSGDGTGPTGVTVSPSGVTSPVSGQGVNINDVQQAIAQGMAPFFQQTSGFSVKQLEEQKREFDAQLQWAREQMEKIGLPQLQIQQYLAQLQGQQFQAQMAQAEANLIGYYTPPNLQAFTWPGAPTTVAPAGTAASPTGSAYEGKYIWYAPGGDNRNASMWQIRNGQPVGVGWADYVNATGNPAFDFANNLTITDPSQLAQYTTAAPAVAATTPATSPVGPTTTAANAPQQTLALGQLMGALNGQPTEAARQFNENLGLQYLTQAAQFAASDPFALSDFLRGAQANPNLPQFLRNLQNNVTGGAAGAVGPTATPAITLPGLQAALAGQGSVNPQGNAALNTIGNVYQRGPAALGTGTLESLTPNELTLLQQGISKLFGSAAAPAFLSAYAASRPVQTAARTSYY